MSTLLGTIAWQRTVIAVLLATNGFTLAVAFAAVLYGRRDTRPPQGRLG